MVFYQILQRFYSSSFLIDHMHAHENAAGIGIWVEIEENLLRVNWDT